MDNIIEKIQTELWDKETKLFKRAVNAAAYYGCTMGVLRNKLSINESNEDEFFYTLKQMEDYGLISFEKYKHKRNLTEVVRIIGKLLEKRREYDQVMMGLFYMEMGESVLIDARAEKIGRLVLSMARAQVARGGFKVEMEKLGIVKITRTEQWQ